MLTMYLFYDLYFTPMTTMTYPLASTSPDDLVRCCLAVVILLLLPLYLLPVSSRARDTTHLPRDDAETPPPSARSWIM